MKIATFNINDVEKRLDNLIDWLAEAEAEPDVVCLQELKTEQAASPPSPRAELGYGAVRVGRICSRGLMSALDLWRTVEPSVSDRSPVDQKSLD